MLFDRMLSELEKVFLHYESELPLRANKEKFFVNRDLRGRVSLVWDEASWLKMSDDVRARMSDVCGEIARRLGKHALSCDRLLITGNAPFDEEKAGAVVYAYGENFPFCVADRMLTESSWDHREESDSLSDKTIVFFSIKGGVGRSTALAVAAWSMAQKGKKVMVLDMDLESPGLSSSLLPEQICPEFGLVDWLVEDVVDNGNAVIDGLFANSPLAGDSRGEIVVVPAHGRNCGDYIAKLGRAWMPRMEGKKRIAWPQRLRTLLRELDNRHHPDFILVDARAGLDEIASACVLDLAPSLVLLFALEGEQTWRGYSILFHYWNKIGQAPDIRENLQIVASMVPPLEDKQPYVNGLRERSWDCFMKGLYDELTEEREDAFNFDCNDVEAPHNPWIINWHPGLHGLKQLSSLEITLDPDQIRGTFPFLRNLEAILEEK